MELFESQKRIRSLVSRHYNVAGRVLTRDIEIVVVARLTVTMANVKVQ